MTSSLLPRDVLNIGTRAGQNHFNEGIGRPSGHTDYSLSQIEGGYSSDPEFIVVSYNNVLYVQFRVRADGATTSSGTHYPRSELRELNESGANISFDGSNTTSWMLGKSRIMHTMAVKGWVCFFQIHDASSDLCRVQLELNKIVMRNTPPGSSSETVKTVQSSYNMTDEIDWKMQVINGTGTVFIGGVSVGTFPASEAGLYYKAGCYSQSGTYTGEDPSDYCAVYMRSFQHWHTGWTTADAVDTGLSGGGGGATGQTLGVGGVATPGGAILATSDQPGVALNITSGGTAANPKVYDGQKKKIGRVTITAQYVVVQNYYIQSGNQYGVVIDADNVTLQNNDISNIALSGDGDLNAITAWGNNIKIIYNTAINYVPGDPGDSHTDFIQTWVSSSHPKASGNWIIAFNKAIGPANPSRNNAIASIHQFFMGEGLNDGGNSGGNGDPHDILICDNEIGDSWNQAIKLDGVDNVNVTRNKFVGSSDHVMEVSGASAGVKFFSDNIIGPNYGNVNFSITAGAGPPSGLGSGTGGGGGGGTTNPPVVNAGTDATVQVNTTFSRTATETNSPSTRTWSIVSGPANVGSTLSTAALLTWIPGVKGTYVLRYSATNAGGTGTDDVTVSVTTTGQTGGGGGSTLTTPTIRSSSIGNTPDAAPTSFVIPKPAGLAVDDYMVVLHGGDADNSLNSMTAAGFNELGSAAPTGTTNAPAMKIWGKVAVSADVAATNFTFNGSGSSDMSGVMIAITAGTYNTANPVVVGTIKSQPRVSSAVQTALALTGVAQGLILALYCSDTNTVVQAYPSAGPSGMSLVRSVQAGDKYSLSGVYSQALTAAGTTNDKTVSPTPGSTQNGWASAQLMINPAVTQGTGGGGGGTTTITTIGNTTDNTSTSASSGDKAVVSKGTATATGNVTAGHARLWMDAGATTHAKMVLYADSAGSPGALLATSDEVVISNTTEAKIDFVFSGAQQAAITNGVSYWPGVEWDDPGTANINFSRGGTASQRLENSSLTYPTAPDPFGTGTANAGPIDAYVDVSTVTGAAAEVNAGPDASIIVSVLFSRSAAENFAGATVTSRAWSIVSGPTGTGTNIGTTDTLSWSPTVVGTYVIRYTVVTSGGTLTDDVTLQVSTTTGGGATGVPPSFVAVGAGISGLATNITPAVPTGIALGMFQVCAIVCAETETITTVPTGWLLLNSQAIMSPAGDPGGPAMTWLYYNTSGLGTGTWIKSGTSLFHAVRAVWKDHTALGTHLSRVESLGTGGKSHSTPTVIPSNADSLIVSVILSDLINSAASPFTPPLGWNERYDSNQSNTTIDGTTNESIAIADVVTSTTTTGSWTSTSPDECATYVFVLEGPIVGGGSEDPIGKPILDAGPDASVQLTGSPFTRTVSENDTGSPIVARLWQILSGPTDINAVLSTGVSVTWTPNAAGTYVLQYSATNGMGTTIDTVTVTVTIAPPTGFVQNPGVRVNSFFPLFG